MVLNVGEMAKTIPCLGLLAGNFWGWCDMPDINAAYTWCVNCCNLPNVGYSQAYRNQQTVNGITYYDCSSYINYGLLAGGFETPDYAPTHNAFTTTTMYNVLPQLGFIQVSGDDLKPGDIGLSASHTEMCYKGGVAGVSAIFMGAHTDNAPLANQVSIGSSGGNPDYANPNFTSFWRYGDGASGEVGYNWIIGTNSQYFTDYGDEQKNNAACIFSYFYFKGWTINAIAGMCGNIMQESTFNPALLEQGVPYPDEGKGTGLVQWTPVNRYGGLNPLHEVFIALGYDWSDYANGTYQCDAIFAEFEQSTGLHDWGIEPQWYATGKYPMKWSEFATSKEDAGYLALVWQSCYERPASIHTERSEYAKKWYEYLATVDPKFPGQNTRDPQKKMPLWMKINYHL